MKNAVNLTVRPSKYQGRAAIAQTVDPVWGDSVLLLLTSSHTEQQYGHTNDAPLTMNHGRPNAFSTDHAAPLDPRHGE
jgi:hypothetical protein